MSDEEKLARLRTALRHPDPSMRSSTVYALSERDAEILVEPLIVLLTDKDVAVRRAAARVLADVDDRRVGEPLIALSLATDEDEDVSEVAWDALEKWRRLHRLGPIYGGLQSTDPDVLRRALDLLFNLFAAEDVDWRIINFIIDAWRNADVAVRRVAAANAVRYYDEEWDWRMEEVFLFLVKDEDPEVQQAALETLAWSRDDRAIEAFIAALRDENVAIRRAAAETIANHELEDKRFLEPLIAALQDRDTEIRLAAATALEWLGDERALAPLTAALQDSDQRVRTAAQSARESIEWTVENP